MTIPAELPCPNSEAFTDTGFEQWRRDRLAEARGILADAAHHPASLVILAACVVADHTTDVRERNEALDLWATFARRPVPEDGAAPADGGGET